MMNGDDDAIIKCCFEGSSNFIGSAPIKANLRCKRRGVARLFLLYTTNMATQRAMYPCKWSFNECLKSVDCQTSNDNDDDHVIIITIIIIIIIGIISHHNHRCWSWCCNNEAKSHSCNSLAFKATSELAFKLNYSQKDAMAMELNAKKLTSVFYACLCLLLFVWA